jgi:hypothetical protein
MGAAGYTRIPGSASLSTKKRGGSAIEPVLSADRASLARVDVAVDGRAISVGRAILQGRSIPLLTDVVDRMAPLLQPEEFTVYVHLYRLAVADDKNVCRASRAELTRRTRMPDRRLGKAIAGLVQKGHVLLVDRDRDGTLYRVLLPDEVLEAGAAPPSPSVLRPHTPAEASPPTTTRPTAGARAPAGRAPAGLAAAARAPAWRSPAHAPASAGPDDRPRRATSAQGATAAPGEAAPRGGTTPRSVGDVCRWFAAAHGQGPGRTGADVAAVVLELLEDGHTFARIPALLSEFVARSPRSMPLRDLVRVIGG